MSTKGGLVSAAAETLASRLGGKKPEIALILGSGLGEIGDRIDNPVVVPYTDLPGFPETTATGHNGNFICGELGGKCVLALQGRYHWYEGYPMDIITLPIRVCIELGAGILITTNASGALNPEYEVGDLMLLDSHIYMLPEYPGKGAASDGKEMYDRDLSKAFILAAEKQGKKIRKGTYLVTTGPSYETAAEHIRFIEAGGDAIGMSTIPEVIIAHENGIRVMAVSLVTDAPHYCEDEETGCLVREDSSVIDGDEIVRIANRSALILSSIIEGTISIL